MNKVMKMLCVNIYINDGDREYFISYAPSTAFWLLQDASGIKNNDPIYNAT